jgi:hypothetical protein
MDFTSQSSKTTDDFDLGSGSLFSSEGKKGRRLLVLSCSDTKCPDVGDMKAVDRYLGPVFQSLKAMGTPADVDVAILSAKHGLIRADTPIQKYNDKMSPKKAEIFKQDAGQMSRIKNTLEGYDNVIVQGGKDYKDVIRAAAGDIKITEIAGGRGIGDQRSAVKQAIAFGKIDTPVYHFTQNTDPGFTKFDKDKLSWFDLGPHVGSTPRAANDRFVDEVFGVNMRKKIRDTMQETGKSREEVLATLKLPRISGNVGYDPSTNIPIGRNTLGGSIPLKADLSKPLLNPKTKKPFTEYDLNEYQADQYSKYKGEYFDASDILGEDPRVDIQDVKKFMRQHAKDLAAEGYTHIPYENAVEGVGDLSYVMLVDRPKGSTKVLQSPSAAKDPAKFDDADFMMEDGGVISLKDKAVNMNRGPQGIEPYIQYMEPGGVVNRVLNYFGYGDEPPIEVGTPIETRNIFEEQREVAEKEKFRPTVEEGIARAKEGRKTDERLTRYEGEGPLMQMIAARIRKVSEQPFTPFEKNLGLRDDPYAKMPSPPSIYQTGVEFGDMETGFDLLSQLDFNKVLLAGLRDSRTLSDFVKTPRRSDVTTSRALQSAQAYYQGKDNIIQMNPLVFEDNFNATLTHELMHKGADLLQKASGQDLEKLRKNVMARGRMSKAEHRYIQSIVNKAYVDRMLINDSIFSRQMLASNEEKAKKRPNDNWYKEQIKEYKKDIQGSYNSTLISEAKRVFDLYMTEENRQKFIKIATPVLEANKISSYFLSKDYDYDKIADIFDIMPFRHSMAIFDTANAIMAEDHITKKFAETMQKAKSSRLTKDYDSYFPEQIPPNFDLYTPKAKAEGGVIGLKDRAVKMHRNVV